MRTAKRMTILLIAGLIGIGMVTAASGQDSAAQQPPNMTAACLVKITVDPSVLPLNKETLEGLLHSSAVRGKAMTEVLGPGAAADRHEIIFIEWLSEAEQTVGAKMPRSSGEQGRDDAMMQELQKIYGGDYAGTLQAQGEKDSVATGYGMGGGSMGGGMTMGRVSGAGTRGRAGGGMVGGMGAGLGMGGGGIGMMGMGMGGVYGGPTRSETAQTVERSVVIRLEVALPDELKPRAKELLDGIVDNLHRSLMAVHEQHVKNIDELRINAISKREDAERRLAQAGGTSSPDEARIREQLDQMIDFSAVTAQTPLRGAFEILKNSAAPVLPLVVQWNALEGARILPDDPAGIDGLPAMRAGTALDLLVKGFDKLGYRIQGGVIFVAPAHSLQQSGVSGAKPKDQADVRTLAARKNELARMVQSLELDLAGMQARRRAIQEQMARAEGEANDRLANDAVTQELEKLMQLSTTQFERLKQLADTGRLSQTELAQGQESVARARIELARRREELTKSVSGSRLEQFNSELSRMTIDEAEKRTQLGILSNQLDEVQRQLVQASTFDPETVRTRIAQETLETINRQIGELETRLATLQPPTVVMLGAN